MPDAGGYVVVDGRTYRVVGRLYDDVLTEVQKALSDGSLLELPVVPEHQPSGEHLGEGTLVIRGDRMPAVTVLTGPLPATGKPIGF
jgi:hypothetical protein